MHDAAHTLKQSGQKVINLLKGTRAINAPRSSKSTETAQQAEERGSANAAQLAYIRTPSQQKRADRKLANCPLPPGSIRRSVPIFAHTGTLTMNDIQRYLRRRGPGGYHLAASDLPDAQLQTIIDFFGAIDYLLQPDIDPVEMEKYHTTWLEILARVERDLPVPEAQALINHALFNC